MNGKFMRNGIVMLVLVVGTVALLYTFLISSPSDQEVAYSQFLTNVRNGAVTEVVQQDLRLTVTGKTPEETYVVIVPGIGFTDVFADVQAAAPEGASIVFAGKEASQGGQWISLLIGAILPVMLIGGFLFFMMRQAQGTNNQAMSFGKSRARMFLGNKTVVTFADVAGVDEAKTELQEVVEFLKYPEKFNSLGARIPRGVLLVGPPGTGKTLMARAVAGEAGVPFFSISGSEFVEMFVGVGASRVRDLFDQAKRNAPCIVFVDEIDAVGRQRGAGLGGSHDEREQTLNQILVEMDGFDTNTNVIVVAATAVNLIGDKEAISDASMAIRALLGEGGDFRAGSEIDEDQVRALLTLLDVAEELNSPRLLKTAENFLLLRISAGGKGRGQVVSAFKGLYEPTAQPGMQGQQGNMPTGMLRGVR